MAAAVAGFDLLDLVDDLFAFDDFTEDRVTDAVGRLLAVEEIVIGGVDKELARRTIGHGCPGHGDGVAIVGKIVGRFVLDRRAGLLRLHRLAHSAPLDHETLDDAVEDGAVVVAVSGVLDEVLGADRRLLGVELQFDLTQVGLDRDGGIHEDWSCQRKWGKRKVFRMEGWAL